MPNPMQDYTAWLDGTSVAHGTLRHVRQVAQDVFNSARWQEWCGPKATLKVTRGARQYFVESIVLHFPADYV